MDTGTILNIERLSRAVSGNQRVMLDILRLSIRLNETLLERLMLTMAHHEWDEAQEVAHTLKGALANIGADELSKLCATVYDSLSQRNYEQAQRTATSLDRARDRLLRSVDSYEQSVI